MGGGLGAFPGGLRDPVGIRQPEKMLCNLPETQGPPRWPLRHPQPLRHLETGLIPWPGGGSEGNAASGWERLGSACIPPEPWGSAEGRGKAGGPPTHPLTLAQQTSSKGLGVSCKGPSSASGPGREIRTHRHLAHLWAVGAEPGRRGGGAVREGLEEPVDNPASDRKEKDGWRARGSVLAHLQACLRKMGPNGAELVRRQRGSDIHLMRSLD